MAISTCNTVYPNRGGMPSGSLMGLGYFNIFVIISNVVLNLFLCYALRETKQLHKFSNKFFFCLSISDTFIALTTQSLVAYLLLSDPSGSKCHVERSSLFFSFSLNQFSGDMILIVALDRYLHMKYLHKYPIKMTTKRGIVLVSLNVVFSIFMGTTAVFVSVFKGFYIWHLIFVILDTLVIITIIILYIRMYFNVKKMVGSLNLKTNINAPANANGKSTAKDRRTSSPYNFTLARTVSFVLISMICSYLPYFLLGSISTYYYHVLNEEPSNELKIAVYFAIILVYMNASFSAIIFMSFNNRIKRFLAKMIGRDSENFSSSDGSV